MALPIEPTPISSGEDARRFRRRRPMKSLILAAMVAAATLTAAAETGTGAGTGSEPAAASNLAQTLSTRQGRFKLSVTKKGGEYVVTAVPAQNGSGTVYTLAERCEFTWDLAGDDEQVVGSIGENCYRFSASGGDIYLDTEEVGDFVDKAVKDYGVSVETKKKTYRGHPDEDTGFSFMDGTYMFMFDILGGPAWLTAELSEDLGAAIAFSSVKTNFGNYGVFVRTQADGTPLCVVTDMPDEKVQLKVRGIRAFTYNILSPSKDRDSFSFGAVYVERGNIGEKILLDSQLYSFLLSKTADSRYAPAIKLLPDITCECVLAYD